MQAGATADAAAWTLERSADGDCLTVRDINTGPDWERWYLLVSDVHWDSPHCDRSLLKRHFDQAAERGAGILSFGDWFDMMQGRSDKRHVKDGIRPEHVSGDYVNTVINDAVRWLEPYRDRLVMMSDGNHETAIRKHLEVDPLDFATQMLGVERMGYSGWVRFIFGQSYNHSSTGSFAMYFHHGSGGGGPVTKGVIGTARRAAYLDGADFVVTGHIHESTLVEIPRLGLTTKGNTVTRTQMHIQLPTYKQEFTPAGGWHVERGAPPKPLGGWWLRMHYDRRAEGNGRVSYELTRAN